MRPLVRPLRYVAAPNPFKGSLGAPAAAAAIARGIRSAVPGAEVLEVPVADGGEGTVEALVAAAGGEIEEMEVEGPLGEPVRARWGLIEKGRTAVIELASASGLSLVPPGERDPRRTSTFGFGQLLENARRRGVDRIVAGIGGSATNDGGAGMAQALGYRLLDGKGRDLERGARALARLDRIDRSGFNAAWSDVEVQVASDVTNPLTGPLGATRVYGPQKGAGPELVEELEAGLRRLSRTVERDLGVAAAEIPGAGAAGGAGFGLVAFLGARLLPGAPLVIEATGLSRALQGARVVFTGEGQVDAQTTFGKGPMEVCRRARAARCQVVVLAGSLGAGWESLAQEGVELVPIAEGPATLAEMMADAPGLLERAAARTCRLMGLPLAEAASPA